ncbi:alpha/beta fold hydrolase [Rudaeicoccus suwonensis]|uniref:Pimeloyl-ACP methyl ester carboxylesterase n=1 Tax=Rudaeicoccus suwonensis TaxID=657409 RepID=A0A561E435_9MICO|nr:alpha/beta hydrolase [Rudaeicoccus suwonensis]TWE10373.1 pimeloyl-ACP methyl ester carboxylesterase [Rudaeicoccus suwonensis]
MIDDVRGRHDTGSVTGSVLRIVFEEYGDRGSPTVVLLHGWPDDVHTWDAVVPALVEAGMHVVVPYLRGFGPTRFLHDDTMRSGQLTALAADVRDLMDGLGIDEFMVVGHDWGARAAYISAAVWPERVRACVALSVGWGTNSPDQKLSLEQAQNYWYHWLFGLPRGADLVREHREELTGYIWRIWNPEADDTVLHADFEVTKASFDNPDWADVTLHSYRSRWGLAPFDPAYAELEDAVQRASAIAVPTLVLHGADDPCNAPTTSAGRDDLFSGGYRRVILPGAGHFPQRTAPEAVCRELVPFLTGSRG